MRSPDITLLVDHLCWVNRRLLDAAGRLSPEAFVSTRGDTTRDLRATLVHELDVEWSWRLAIQGRPAEEWAADAELQPDEFPDLPSLRQRWEQEESALRDWVASLSDAELAAPTHPGLSRSARPLWQFIMHIVSHGVQQQADAATLLTRAGASPGEIGFLEFLGSREGRA